MNNTPTITINLKRGTQLTPRRFLLIKKITKGSLGDSKKTPLVKGVTSNLDKLPWKNIEPLETKMESQFLRPVYTGQSIAPFRVLKPNTGIIPWDNSNGVMNAQEAENQGYTCLSNYLEKVEKLWNEKSSGSMTFKRRMNYNGTLESQFPIPKLRLVYTTSGTHIAAVLLENYKAIIEVSLYWTTVDSMGEGVFLEGILNSDYLIQKIRHLQAQGQWGARHFGRHLLKPPIPKYSSKNPLHNDIASCSNKIRKIVQNIELDPSWYFTKSRKKIRDEIKNREEWQKLNNLVYKLLESPSEEEAKIQKKRIQKARQRVPKDKRIKKVKSGTNKS